MPIAITNPRWDPLTSVASSSISAMKNMSTSAVELVASPYTAIRQAAPEDSAAKTTGKAVAKFGKTFGKFNGRMFQNMVVDMPHAMTEGLRAVPKLYGEDVKSHGEVTDAASGFTVAGKTLVDGWTDGVTGLYTKPMQGAKEGGALGFAAGAGKGIIGFTTKTSSATIGLFTYPMHGISKSIVAPFKSATRKEIMEQRRLDGEHTDRMDAQSHDYVISRFDELTMC